MTTRSRVFKLQAGEVEDWAVGFGGRLKTGELLTGTPKVTVHAKDGAQAQYAGVAVSLIARNTAAVTDADGVVHQVDQATEFRVTAANDAVDAQYTVRAECSTTNGRSLVEAVTMSLAGPPET
jgi:hypothetical protein